MIQKMDPWIIQPTYDPWMIQHTYKKGEGKGGGEGRRGKGKVILHRTNLVVKHITHHSTNYGQFLLETTVNRGGNLRRLSRTPLGVFLLVGLNKI